jgi:hypothetical protein
MSGILPGVVQFCQQTALDNIALNELVLCLLRFKHENELGADGKRDAPVQQTANAPLTKVAWIRGNNGCHKR